MTACSQDKAFNGRAESGGEHVGDSVGSANTGFDSAIDEGPGSEVDDDSEALFVPPKRLNQF